MPRVSTEGSELSDNRKLRFSFEYYDSTSKYCLSSCTGEQVKKTLSRLKDINSKTLNELRRERWVYHFNEVIWENTKEKGGFPDSRLSKLPAFHFALLGVNQQLARVFGAYSQDTFYIVWFDLNHKIYPSPLKNT